MEKCKYSSDVALLKYTLSIRKLWDVLFGPGGPEKGALLPKNVFFRIFSVAIL